MRILIDIAHPAHVHFFREPIRQLRERGHEIRVTSRDKDCADELLDQLDIERVHLSAHSGGMLGLAKELIARDAALWREVRRFRPDRLAAVGGTFVAHVGALTRTPSIVFYDTENARLQNAITYPLATHVAVPRAYSGWLPKDHSRYNGYHELSYLRPSVFFPDKAIAIDQGLAESGETFLLRLVSWQANHDFGERGWNTDILEKCIHKLQEHGQVIISAEGELPEAFESYRFKGNAHQIHHLMAFCRAVVGESATMASEAAVLGTPAIFIARSGRGYTDEQEERYGLVRNVRSLNWPAVERAIEEVLAYPEERWVDARQELLDDTIDVASMASALIESVGRPRDE